MKLPVLRVSVGLFALLTTAAVGARVEHIESRRGGAAGPLDSARDEMAVGRFWHATRILREAGAEDGAPAEVLLLARAEAGWRDWRAVRLLLEGAHWLDAQEGGEGWRLLGRADEEQGRWQDAADAYGAYLDHAAPDDPRRLAEAVRHARALARSGSDGDAVAALEGLPPEAAPARSWVALELLGPAVEGGDTARVSALLSLVTDDQAARSAWMARPRARLAAEDTAGALVALEEVADGDGSRRHEARVQEGLLLAAGGRTGEARALLIAGVDSAPRVSAARAAAGLVDMAGNDRGLLLRMAPMLDRAGDGARALKAYDRAWTESRHKGVRLPEWARLARARLMATVRSRQDDALEEFRALYASTGDARIGARTLDVWANMRRRQGRSAQEKTLRRWLLDRYPSSPEAIEVLWDRASQDEAAGNISAALKGYAAIIENAPSQARAGEARMRTAQLELGKGLVSRSADVYRTYLKDFPEGRRWTEAAYWAARLDLELGDSLSARRLVDRIRRDEPVSYYAVVGADLFHESYDVDVPEGEPAVMPEWLIGGLRRLDLLQEAGLKRGADAEEARLVARARGSSATLLGLAEALIERGRTVSGINLGWEIRREGHPWDRRLLKVVYPFPYRELVRREAREWNLDPIMLAAVIRQESAFAADIVSGAGAVGLMQVLPPTGRQLARTHGPKGFEATTLTTPEINLHLGAAFLVEMSQRYHGDLPLTLVAYNAGPTRANRWGSYPEAADPLRFTERIPFDETRGYVKNVTRNLGLYEALYGDE
ncbi:MAG: transglycosylase SLT domain-containing protein [Gemmatimonadetes bacterium]|nr:transglycosylase SLT domain-containing protein [Gemmatimonadota bacterium]